jgi:protease-4
MIFADLPFTQSKESFIKEEIGEENYKVLQQKKTKVSKDKNGDAI